MTLGMLKIDNRIMIHRFVHINNNIIIAGEELPELVLWKHIFFFFINFPLIKILYNR